MTIVSLLNQNKKIALKIVSLIIGYQLWLTISSSLIISHSVTIPICTYNQQENQHIDAPEALTVTLQGPRRLLSLINYKDLCVHLNGATLANGTQYITLSAHHLLLPHEISVTHYTPLRVIVTLT